MNAESLSCQPRVALGGFSRREPIIGDNVKATTADIVTAPTSVNANSVNSAPVRPP